MWIDTSIVDDSLLIRVIEFRVERNGLWGKTVGIKSVRSFVHSLVVRFVGIPLHCIIRRSCLVLRSQSSVFEPTDRPTEAGMRRRKQRVSTNGRTDEQRFSALSPTDRRRLYCTFERSSIL